MFMDGFRGNVGAGGLRMLQDLQELTKHLGSERKGYTVEWVRDIFKDRVEVQPYTIGRCAGTNIVIHFGANPEKRLVGAHYDTVAGTPGANDNGAAVVEIVEAVRYLISHAPETDVTFVLFDNEEPPHFATEAMGSWQYLRNNPAPGKALILDVAGIGIPFFSFNQSDPGMNLELLLPGRNTPASDSLNFKAVGIPCALVGAIPEKDLEKKGPSDIWYNLHTQQDTVDKIDPLTMQEMVSVILGFIGLDRVEEYARKNSYCAKAYAS